MSDDAKAHGASDGGSNSGGSDDGGRLDYQLLFEGSPHPYMVLRPDESFTIAAVNDRYMKVTETRRAEIVGRGLFDVFPDNPADAGANGVNDLRASLNRVLREGVQDIMGVQKYDIPGASGEAGFTVKYWTPVNTPVFDATGAVAFILHYAEDVTEFMLARERSSEANERIETLREHATRMEADVRQRTSDVKDANRRIKEAMEELAHREAELAHLNERLTELDRAKTEFFSNISHEFRTPLTLLLGPLGEILAGSCGAVPADVRAALETAERNALRLLKLVDALLDFSRLEAGRTRVRYEPVDLSAATVALASHFGSAGAMAGLRLVVDCPPLGAPVHVDPDMWEKIVLNLLSNAFKFTFKGEIRITLRRDGDSAVLSVGDTGTGIPEHELSRIFERFHRVEGARGRSFEGSGIGLALVHDLVTLHGGTVAVSSTVGQGSEFRVTLPFGTDHLPPDSAIPAPPSNAPSLRTRGYVEEAMHWLPDPAPTGMPEGMTPRGASVLVADDNADMRAYLIRLLEGAGHSVQAVADGEAALAVAKDGSPPDLVVTDVMMPGLDGFGLLRALRGDPRTADILVFLLSARVGEEARLEGLAAGADDYVVKPFRAPELLARIDGALRLARNRRETTGREHDRRAESALELGRAALQESEENLRYTFDLNPQLSWTATPDGAILDISRSWVDLTGMTRSDLLGDGWLRVLHPDDAASRLEAWKRSLRTGEVYDAEYRLRRADGSYRWMRSRALPRRNADGQIVRWYGTSEDIEDRKVAEQRARDLQVELWHASRVSAMSEMAAALAHEINQPLGASVNYIEACQELLAVGTPQGLEHSRKALEAALIQVTRAGEVVRRLRSYISKGNVERQPSDLNGLVREATGLALAGTERKNLRVRYAMADDLPAVTVDPVQIQQVVVNLVRNAVEAMPQDDPRRNLTLATRRTEEGMVEMSVGDTGPGLDEEMARDLFKPFLTTKATGMGLGLSICRSIVTAHNGRIRAEPNPGGGTVFRVSLPAGSKREECGGGA